MNAMYLRICLSLTLVHQLRIPGSSSPGQPWAEPLILLSFLGTPTNCLAVYQALSLSAARKNGIEGKTYILTLLGPSLQK